LSLFFICSQLIVGSEGHSQQVLSQSGVDGIPLFLPINKTQFPGLIEDLQSELTLASEVDSNLSKIDLSTTDYWHPYQQGIRQGRRGVYFAAPHFVAWLVNQHRFDPTLKLAGILQYVIVARRADSHIFEVRDLANKNVCVNATMDLGFLLVRESMRRSLLPAKIQRVTSVSDEMKADNKSCDAFSLNEHLFLEFSRENPFQYIRLQQSKKLSHYAYALHPSISPKSKRALRKFLASKKVKEILRPMYRLFAKQPVILGGKASSYPASQMQLLMPYWGPDLSDLKAP